MIIKEMHKYIEKIGEEYGGLTKSCFVLASNIININHHLYLHTKVFPNQNIVFSIYKLKENALRQIIRTKKCEINLNNTSKDPFNWVYVISLKRDDIGFNLIASYDLFKELVNKEYKDIKTTDLIENTIFYKDKKINQMCYKGSKLKLSINNIIKSTDKVKSKLNALI